MVMAHPHQNLCLPFYPEKVQLVKVHKWQKTAIPLDILKFSPKQVDSYKNMFRTQINAKKSRNEN